MNCPPTILRCGVCGSRGHFAITLIEGRWHCRQCIVRKAMQG